MICLNLLYIESMLLFLDWQKLHDQQVAAMSNVHKEEIAEMKAAFEEEIKKYKVGVCSKALNCRLVCVVHIGGSSLFSFSNIHPSQHVLYSIINYIRHMSISFVSSCALFSSFIYHWRSYIFIP